MSSVTLLLTAGFAGLALLGVPFAFAIAAVVAASLYISGISPMLLPQSMIAGTQSFTLLAIPFFVLAGSLMSAGGLSQRLVGVADVLVRHRTGGIGMVAIVAAAIFATISGSAPATTAAIGAIMIPAMVERGYDRGFSTALVVSASVLAPLIPPSIAFVIWGVLAEESITKLFLSGIGPALLMAAGFAVLVWFYARKRDLGRQPRANFNEVLAAFRQGIWALLAPVIILGGLYGGVFTPTEAAVVSCVYAIFVGIFIEKKMTWAELPEIVGGSVKMMSIVMGIIIFSSGFGILIAQEQIAPKLAGWLEANIESKWQTLLLLNLVFFALAAVMDEIAILVVLGPLLLAIAETYSIDPIHFGAIIVTNAATGMASPPIGYCLFVGMAVSGMKMGQIARYIWPFLIVMLLVTLLVTYLPSVALFLL